MNQPRPQMTRRQQCIQVAVTALVNVLWSLFALAIWVALDFAFYIPSVWVSLPEGVGDGMELIAVIAWSYAVFRVNQRLFSDWQASQAFALAATFGAGFVAIALILTIGIRIHFASGGSV